MGTTSKMVDSIFPGEGQGHEQMDFGTLSKYDVFLNHRGPDLKMTFVSHLNKALRFAGCEPFLDAKSLVKGKCASKSINEALIGVRVHVAIFSRRYAESKYCLNELCDMLASKKPFIPVFYDVEPENLRWTEVGPFAEGFRKHLGKGRDGNVMRWKAALSQAADITGFRLVDCGNDTVKLEEKIVGAVLNDLPTPPPMAPARHLVGMKGRAKNVIDMLHKMGDNVGVMGICGMGGIGKTTLAKEVFTREHSRFGSWSFLSDVKEAKGVAIMDLQMKMVTDLLQVDSKKMHWGSFGWFDRIRKHKQRVFIVIDDISKRHQFDDLIPNVKNLPFGSRVVITSRDSGVLKNIMLDVSQSALYEVPGLNFPNSMELFLQCSFRKTNIDDVEVAFHEFIKDITRACGGLPLALEVMGGLLSDKKNLSIHEGFWQDAIMALRKDGDIMTSLQFSYDNLGEDEKFMFLDIACFILGHPERIAIEVWNSSDLYGSSRWVLNKLIAKCLVKVVNSQLSMHDLLRDMGRNVVLQKSSRRPEWQSHIWDSSVAVKVLQRKQGSDKVLALTVVGEKCETTCKAELYAKMWELRYLQLDACPVDGDFSEWCEELRWLQWRYMPFKGLPSSLTLPNLVVLDLGNSDSLSCVWPMGLESGIPACKELRMLILNNCGELKELPQDINKLVKLKFLNLEGCRSFNKLPDALGDLTELDHLNLKGCWSLNALPDSLGDLAKLNHLNVSGCESIEYLPNSSVKLLKLKELRVSWCSGLKKLPLDFGMLKSLEVFVAGGIALEELPESFGLLEGLKKVKLSNCKYLRALSENFGCLKNLQSLDLDYCSSLMRLPDSFSELSNLVKLFLSRCELLEELPSSIHKLKKLERLTMRGAAMSELPEKFDQLSSLNFLNLDGCRQLRNLGERFGYLGCLETLRLSGCKCLTRLPDSFFELSNLKELNLSRCGLLEELPPSIHKLKKLKSLILGGGAMTELPEKFEQLGSLKYLRFNDCKQLQILGERFGYLGCLNTLELSSCESLTKLSDSLFELSNLERLFLSGCELLKEVPPSIHKLKSLKSLTMVGAAMTELPKKFEQLRSLEYINFTNCRRLRNLGERFGYLGCLETLSLSGCESLSKFPDSFCELSNLENLYLSGCELLEEVPPSIHKLKKLKTLYMGGAAMKELPEKFDQLQSLEFIDFTNCRQLRNLGERFGYLGCLKSLLLSGCESLTKLPDSFFELSNLEELWLPECELLEEVPPSIHKLKKLQGLSMGGAAMKELPEKFYQLRNLIEVHFWDCNRLHTLCEDFGRLQRLKFLDLRCCESLLKLPDSFSLLNSLEDLNLSWCKVLRKLPSSISGLKRLRILRMGSTALEGLPEDFGQLHRLQTVDFNDCKQLQNLCENFGSLGSLQELNLMFCESLKMLPDSFARLSKLEKLSLFGCKVLHKLPSSVHGLRNLGVLHMGSTALTELPEDFGELLQLKEADFRSCKVLQSLGESFGSLTSLRKLNLDGCGSLEELPESFSCLSNMEELSMFGCKQIQKLTSSICRLKRLKVIYEEFGSRRSQTQSGSRSTSTSELARYFSFI